MIITRQRIRIACDLSSYTTPLDIKTGQPLKLWRGNDVQFELGVFYGDAMQSIEDFASITLLVRDSSTGTVRMAKTIDAADLDNSVDAASWADESKQHGLVPFTSAESNISLDDAASKECWLVIAALTTDSPAHQITLAAGKITFVEDGYDTGEGPPSPADDYYTQAQADARYMLQSDAGTKTRWSDGMFYIENSENAGWWHPLIVKGNPSEPYFEPAPGVQLP